MMPTGSSGFASDSIRASTTLKHFAKKLPKGELPDWLLKVLTLVNPPLKAVVPELGRERHCSNEKARRVLGWTPRTEEEAIIESAQTLIDLNVV